MDTKLKNSLISKGHQGHNLVEALAMMVLWGYLIFLMCLPLIAFFVTIYKIYYDEW